MLQSCLANGHVKFLVNLSRDENTCLLIVNCLAYHYFDYFTLSIDSCGVKIDIRSVLYFCTVWTGAHGAINWSETNTHLFYFNLLHRVHQFEEYRNKEQIYVLTIAGWKIFVIEFLFENWNHVTNLAIKKFSFIQILIL